MNIHRKSLANAVIYSIISLVYTSALLYTGRVGFGKSVNSSFPLTWFTALGIIILISSIMVQIAIVSVAQSYDEFQCEQLLSKVLIGLAGVTVVMAVAILMVAFFDVNAKMTLYVAVLIHWIFITILEMSFIIQLKK